MASIKETNLARMLTGQSGVVKQINGGHSIVNRLNSLGIRPGKRIRKTSSMIMHGPITIEVDRAQIALGFGMARRIIVDPE